MDEFEEKYKEYVSFREANTKEEYEDAYLEIEELKKINKPVLKKFYDWLQK